MSFFGFDPALPGKNSTNTSVPGFSQPRDPFAELARAREELPDDTPVYNYGDDYQDPELSDEQDAFNDDTFGGVGASAGRDFDFHGSTAKVSETISKEQDQYHGNANRGQTQQQKAALRATMKPAAPSYRSGYERYQDPRSIPDLQINQAIWGQAAAPRTEPTYPQPALKENQPARQPMTLEEVEQSLRVQRKPMTLEEVEAAMRATALKNTPEPASVPAPPPAVQSVVSSQPSASNTGPRIARRTPQDILRNLTGPQALRGYAAQHSAQQTPNHVSLHNQQLPLVSHPLSEPKISAPSPQHPAGFMAQQPTTLLGMTEEQRLAALADDAKRAKRNHKIFLMARGNGLMTPSDKNFITRIQLQSLVVATSNPVARGSVEDDFYYQVFRSLRSDAPAGVSNYAYDTFAQTYLYQTGVRVGGKRINRALYQTQRMEQQVERAVEAAKSRPKASTLSMENTLGKISFSNSKTPKPLLSLKRPAELDRRPSTPGEKQGSRRLSPGSGTASRKGILRDIENLFSALLACESQFQTLPPAPQEGDHEGTQRRIEWQKRSEALAERLWQALRMDVPLEEYPTILHPFISMLGFSKGKKAIARSFHFIDPSRQINMLTLTIVYLDQLDVVQQVVESLRMKTPMTAALYQELKLFNDLVLIQLLRHVAEAPMSHISGLVGILISRNNVRDVLSTQVGLSILSQLLSRASIIKQSITSGGSASAPGTPGGSQSGKAGGAAAEPRDLEQWQGMYDQLFKAVEPLLAYVIKTQQLQQRQDPEQKEEQAAWGFLASLGSGASHAQQERLCLAVVEQVRDTLALAKTMPKEQGMRKRANVNLFMQSIGLDVDMLDGGA